jgi:hypothetical protein
VSAGSDRLALTFGPEASGNVEGYYYTSAVYYRLRLDPTSTSTSTTSAEPIRARDSQTDTDHA